MSEYKDTTNRHLRHKLQSLGRRLDELEEATSKLQKAEDELLDLQDKIIQAEGSNSSLLADVETLRKRVLKIEGKDEEICKAEELCRSVREKLEEEEKLTRGLRMEIERLQARMAELEKLEEAFGKCKSDCTQLCLSLNEEKNLNRKLSTELEALRARQKEVDASEARLDKAEQALTTEMERLKGLTQTFLSERKRLLEKQKEDRELILKLTEQQKNRISSADYSRRDSRDLRIEDELSTGLSTKLTRKKSLDYLKIADETGLRNEKNSLEGQEDNKVRDLNQEVERLKSRLKQLEVVEEDLKDTESKNSELLEKFNQEKMRSQTLAEQVEKLKMQIYGGGSNGGAGNGTAKVLENGKLENEESNVRGGFRQEKPKYRSAAATDPMASKYKSRDVSPQQRREPKLRNKDLSKSAESSPKSVRRALSPAQKNRRGLKTSATPASDNGLKEMGRGFEEKSVSSSQVSNIDNKKVSVLSRYPPAANDQKSGKTPLKTSDGDSKKSQVEKFSRLYGGSDSESNSSDVMPMTSSKTLATLSAEKDHNSEQEFANPSQDSPAVLGLSKANGSYTAYRSHVSPAVASDQGSEGHSSASESESIGPRPSVGDQESSSAKACGRSSNLKYSRPPQIHSDRSSARSSYEEEGHKALMAEGSQEPSHTLSGIEIRRVCSPREALRSKAVIKPAIVEIDRKEVMSGSGGGTEPLPSTGKPKISTKPVLTSKMTSSITIYPNDLSSSRTSSRSSSVCSEPIAKERHTSTSNIIISPSSEHRGGLSIPYEISIPKSEITLRHCQDGADDDDCSDSTNVIETARVGTHPRTRSSFSLLSPESTSDFNNDGESGFESSSSSSTTTVTSWRSHSHNHQQQQHHHNLSSQDDCLPEMRNVTVRSTWKNRGALSVDEVPRLDGSEDESEPTWRAYRATTVLDAEEVVAPVPPSQTEGRGGKLSPAEVYMRRITGNRDAQEPGHHSRVKGMTTSPSDSGLGRTVPHEPVSAKERQPWSRKHPTAVDETEPQSGHWRRQSPASLDPYDRSSRTDSGSSSNRVALSSRSVVGRTPDRSRPWTSRHLDN